MTVQIQTKTVQAWTDQNPILAAGEPGYESNTQRLKVGDGTTTWNSLPYAWIINPIAGTFMMGDKGDDGDPGTDGTDGTDGTNGTNANVFFPTGLTGGGFFDQSTGVYTPANFQGNRKLHASLAGSAAGVSRSKGACVGPSNVAGWDGVSSQRALWDYPLLFSYALAELGYSVSAAPLPFDDFICLDHRVSFTGTWTHTTQPSSIQTTTVPSGGSLTFNTQKAHDHVDWQVKRSSGAFAIDVDFVLATAGQVTVTNGTYTAGTGTITPDGGVGFTTVSVSGLTPGPHVIVLVAAASVTIYMVDPWITNGVSIANFGASSTGTANWADTTTGTDTLINNVLEWDPDFVILDLGLLVNDKNTGVALSTGLANLETIVGILQTVGIEVILNGVGPFISPTHGAPDTAFWQAQIDLADAKGCMLIDNSVIFGETWANANALGLEGTADTVHQSIKGMNAVAARLCQSLGIAPLPVKPKSLHRTAQASWRRTVHSIVQGTWVKTVASTSYDGGSIGTSTVAMGDGLIYDIDIDQGTWNFIIYAFHGPAYGIVTYDISCDGGTTWIPLGTAHDYYNAALAADGACVYNNIKIPASGPALFRFRILSKNASSTGYGFPFTSVEANRTDTLI